MKPCPFCDEEAIEAERGFVCRHPYWFAFKPMAPPGHVPPASPLHTLLVPRIHVMRFAMLEASFVRHLPNFIDITLQALGVGPYADHNIGINQGAAAGQTVEHLHLHLIPRQEGDVDDPIGGIITPLAERLWAKDRVSRIPSLPETLREDVVHVDEDAGPWRRR